MRTNDPVNRFCVNRLDDLGKMRRTKELRQLRSKKLLELFLSIWITYAEILAYRSLSSTSIITV